MADFWVKLLQHNHWKPERNMSIRGLYWDGTYRNR